MKKAVVLGATLTVLASMGTAVFLERDAQACGGCFNPPETPTVVTDHRMVLTVAKDQSTLYDQIKYTGAPSAFAWVLPISGEVNIGLSADVVFSGLDQMTQTQVLPPPRNCPPQPDGCTQSKNGGSSSGSGGGLSSPAPEESGVNVIKKEVVGPYETVQLAATDPGALRKWLSDNGFNVPPDVAPVVDNYVTEKFNFLALKLVPGKNTQDMRPVRVTTKGANVALPLRMVAAGTGSTVGISLWVIGEGRYEPQNFPSFVVATDDISWDWTQNKSNYIDVRAQKTTANGGKGWEVESSSDLQRQTLESIVNQGTYNGSGPYPTTDEQRAAGDYLPVKDGQGNVTKTALEVRREDLETLFHGISTTRVTRMRADLTHAALDADLVMTASKDQAPLSNIRQVVKELNQPLCPIFEGCVNVGTAPRDEAIARSKSSTGGETFSCVASKGKSPKTWLGIGFAAVGIAELVRRRLKKAHTRAERDVH